jgi:hypothetical protein
MKPRHLITTTALLATLAFTPVVQAATVAVTNLHTETGTTANKFVTSTGVNAVANSFTTGAGAGWTLDTATVDMSKIAAGSENITARIYSDSSGLPGGVLATSVLNLTDAGRADRTFDFSGAGLTLAPTTTYWLSLSSDQQATTSWSHVNTGETSTTSGLPGWTIGSPMHIDNGSNWISTVSGGSGLFSISVVPEPGSLVAVGCFLAAGLSIRKRHGGV